MTSNLASEEIADYGLQLRRESEELAKAQYSGKFINETDTKELEKVVVSRYFKDKVIRPILKRHFKRDEFLGRINEIVSQIDFNIIICSNKIFNKQFRFIFFLFLVPNCIN